MKATAGVVLVTVLSLGLLQWLATERGAGEPLVPGPERVVGQFVRDLKGDPNRAFATLSPGLRLRTSVMDLVRVDQELRRRYRVYEFAGATPRGGGRHDACCIVSLRTADGRILRPELRLHRNPVTGLWRISSFSGLSALTGRPRLGPAPATPVSI